MRLPYFLLAGLLLAGTRPARAQAALAKLGSIAVPSLGTELAVSGTTAYVFTASASQQQLLIYDVSTPAAPQLKSTLILPTAPNLPPLPFRHAVVSNGTLYASSYPTAATTPHSQTTLAIDVHTPTNPFVVGMVLSVGGDERFLAASGDYLYTVADNNSVLYVYNRSQLYSSYLSVLQTVNLPYSLSGLLRGC